MRRLRITGTSLQSLGFAAGDLPTRSFQNTTRDRVGDVEGDGRFDHLTLDARNWGTEYPSIPACTGAQTIKLSNWLPRLLQEPKQAQCMATQLSHIQVCLGVAGFGCERRHRAAQAMEIPYASLALFHSALPPHPPRTGGVGFLRLNSNSPVCNFQPCDP